MIYTSSYKKSRKCNYKTYSISKDMGRDASYYGYSYLKLAPKESFFRIWRNNIGKISEKENSEYYIREFYHQILEDLDPGEVYDEINNSILLCYEDSNQFCHRHIVSAWFELFLGIDVFEVNINGYEMSIAKRPTFIKEYLEKVIRESKKISDSDSINDVYLKDKGEIKTLKKIKES